MNEAEERLVSPLAEADERGDLRRIAARLQATVLIEQRLFGLVELSEGCPIDLSPKQRLRV